MVRPGAPHNTRPLYRKGGTVRLVTLSLYHNEPKLSR
nr:MAG TPA_asm: hypothetical protein [Caudoviricetes sp.]